MLKNISKIILIMVFSITSVYANTVIPKQVPAPVVSDVSIVQISLSAEEIQQLEIAESANQENVAAIDQIQAGDDGIWPYLILPTVLMLWGFSLLL